MIWRKLIFTLLIVSMSSKLTEATTVPVVLDPLVMSLTTTRDKADYVRYLYYLVNGAESPYVITGPSGGFVGIINSAIGRDGIGQILRAQGVFQCSDIPTYGTATKDLSDGTYVVTFSSVTTKTIPSHFGNFATESFDKSLSITRNGTTIATLELKCAAGSTITTSYLRMNSGSATERSFETYFQMDSKTHAAYVDFFSTYPNDTEKTASRFITTDGNEYRLYLIRTQSSNSTAHYFGLHGKRSANLVKLHIRNPTGGTALADANTIAGASTTNCIAMANATDSSACDTHSLSVSDPTSSTTIAGSTFDWTIQSTANLSLTTFP